MHNVAVVKYENPSESLKKAISEVGGIGDISADSKVFIKPNLVTWYVFVVVRNRTKSI